VLRHVAEFPTGVTEAEPVISRRPALDGRSFPNQRNRCAKVGFVDLEGVGLDLEGKISFWAHWFQFMLRSARLALTAEPCSASVDRNIIRGHAHGGKSLLKPPSNGTAIEFHHSRASAAVVRSSVGIGRCNKRMTWLIVIGCAQGSPADRPSPNKKPQ
jgi:hypothetical protein